MGSGLEFAAECSEDILSRNWQRLILTHLYEKEHIGVLTGSPITDMKITLINGRAHQKHTEGGDFRQATYRAVRQGLKKATSVLLEPYFEFRLEVPEASIGRAMTDIEKMCGKFNTPTMEGGMAVITGCAPVVTMREYQKDVIAYTKGHGRLSCSLQGYQPCHNTEEVVEVMNYDSERDLYHPTSSIFCAHGAGFLVPWDQVENYMHLENQIPSINREISSVSEENWSEEKDFIGVEEIDSILEKTYYANKKDGFVPHKGISGKRTKVNATPVVRTYQKKETTEEFLLVDGYNVIFGCEELKSLADENMDSAKDKLMDLLCNYQGSRGCHTILVFDAYRMEGHQTEIFNYHNIQVVYTKEAETADMYIEKFAHENASKYQVTVATSDGLEQIIIRGKGCFLLSARDLWEEMMLSAKKNREEFLEKQETTKNYLFDHLDENLAEHMEKLRKGE